MAFSELAPASRQRIWGWPAVVNLTLGGTGSAFYLLGAFFAFFSRPWPHDNQFIAFPLLAAVVVSSGFAALAMEAGRPLRAYRLFSRLPGSWMSVESLAGALFIVAAVASHWFPIFFLRAVAVAAALVLIVSQGMMLYRAVGVDAWHRGVIPFVFVTSGLMSACGLLLLNVRQLSALDRLSILCLALMVLLNLAAWLLYLFGRTESDSNRGFKFLRHPAMLLLIAGLGHLLPLLYLGGVLFSGDSEPSTVAASLFRVGSGLMLLAGGVGQKIGIVLAAGYHRPIFIDTVFRDSVSSPVR
jgi:DMSO reductase anchor subunit